MELVGVSAGTAVALNLTRKQVDVLPETAYLLLGEKCPYHCKFCSRSLKSISRPFLSRVTWPLYPWEEVREKIFTVYRDGNIKRVCFQVTGEKENHNRLLNLGKELVEEGIRVNASTVIRNFSEGEALLEAGFDRISLALDCASPELMKKIKGISWEKTLSLLETLATSFSNRITTHLIAGLGEEERDMIFLIDYLLSRNIEIGLFAFTPLKGTPMAEVQPPSLNYYRRLQAARYLLKTGRLNIHKIVFDSKGFLLDWGRPRQEIETIIRGEAFQTSGCSGCNRPFYNERPGRDIYNYPHSLHSGELEEALGRIFSGTRQEEKV